MADGSVIIDTKLDQSGLKTGLSKLGTDITKGITSVVTAASAALTALAGYSIKVGSDFEYAISGVAATMGLTADEITEVSEKAKELGASTKFTATEAAEGFNILAMAGLSLDEQLQAINATLSLAAAGEMSMDNAAGYLTTTVKAMSNSFREAGINMEDCTRIADMYAKGATLANTSTAQLGDAVSTAASVGGAYNQSLSTITTSLLALAEKGYQGSAAGNYLARAMSDLYAPTDDAKKALDELGVSIYDSEGKQRDFIDIVNDLNKAFESLTEEEKAVYTGQIFTMAGLKAFNSIAGNSAEQLAELQGKLEDCTGAAEKMADTKLDNLQGDITILKSATEGLGIAMYEAMSDIGTSADSSTGMMRECVQEATTIMSELTEAVNKDGFDGLVDALGDALAKAVNKIVEYIPMLVEGGVSIVSSLAQGLTESAGNLASSVTDLVSILIDGIVNIATDFITLGAELILALCSGLSDNADSITSSIADGLINLSTAIVEYAPQLVTAGTELLQSLANGILDALPTLSSAIPQLVSTLVTELSAALVNLVAVGTSIIESLLQGIIDALPSLIATIPTIITAILDLLNGAIPTLVSCASGIINAIITALPDLINQIVGMLPTLIEQVVSTLTTNIPIIIQAVIGIVQAIANELPNIVQLLAEQLPNIAKAFYEGIGELLPILIEAVTTLLFGLIEALPDLYTALYSALPELINGIQSALYELLPQLVECGVELLVSLIQGLPDAIYAIVNVLPVIVTAIISALIGSIPLLIECGIDLLVALVSALPQIIITIVAVLPQIVSAIIQALVDSIPLLIQCGIDLLVSLIGALPDIILALTGAMPTIISSIIDAILDNLPLLIQCGIDLLTSLIGALPEIISTIVSAIPDIISSIVDAFSSGWQDLSDIGRYLIEGVWNGISNCAEWLWNHVSGFFGDLTDRIKDFFGIASPSKLFKSLIGENLMLGVAVGISDGAQEAIDATLDAAQGISDVEFEIKPPKIDVDGIDYDALVSELESAVDTANTHIGRVVSASVTEDAYRTGSDNQNVDGDEDGSRKPEYVENNIYIDGKRTARILTPYVSKELEWEDK